MPHSDLATHRHMNDVILRVKKKKEIKILDCGSGSGLIAKSISNIEKKTFIIDGIEIYTPYRDDLKKEIDGNYEKYNQIFWGDNFAHKLSEFKKNEYDIVIFGDSLEHLHADWAEHSLAEAMRVANYFVIVNMPIVPLPQTNEYGNDWEIHRLTWDGSQLEHWGAENIGGNNTVRCFAFNTKNIPYNVRINLPMTKQQQLEGDGCQFTDSGLSKFGSSDGEE